MTLRSPEETFVRSSGQLFDLWRDLMGTGGFAQRSLWMIFLQSDGELSPVISPIDDIPAEPDDAMLGSLARIVDELLAEFGGSAAFLLSRAGPTAMSDADRRWARALRAAIGPDLSPWPVHLATHGTVQVFAPDDLIG